MRVLLTFACALVGAVALALLLLPKTACLILAGCSLAACAILRAAWGGSHRLPIILLGFAVGLLWCVGCWVLVERPASELAGQTVEITGTATDYSTKTEYGVRVPAKITVDGKTVKSLLWLYTDQELSPGDTVSVTAELRGTDGDDNLYYRSEGIFLLAYGKTQPIVDRRSRVPFRYFFRKLAHSMEQTLQACVPDDAVGYAMALTTGNRSRLTSAEKSDLKRAGIYHVLALSGMHMTVLISSVSMLIHRKRRKAMVGIPVCILFTVLTGATPSMVRAAVMQCLILAAPLFNREEDSLTSLSAAAILLTLQNPWCIMNWGMQLSFASMLGIILFSRQLCSTATRRKSRRPRLKKLAYAVRVSFATTASALVFTVPLMMAYFGMISLVAPVTNLLTGWAVGWCFRGSLLTAVIGGVFPWGGRVLGWVLAWPIRYVQIVARTLAGIPYAALGTDSVYGAAWVVLVYGILIALAAEPKEARRLLIPGGCVLGALAVCLVLSQLENSGFQFTVLNVGQGQCLCARYGGGTVLIDCGGSYSSGDTAADYLNEMGERRVDLLILTHYDSDHISGVSELLARMDVTEILMPDSQTGGDAIQAIESEAVEAGTKVALVSEDVSVSLGDGTISVFAPVGEDTDNGASLSALIDVDGTQTLVTGDMDETAERQLLSRHALPDVDILVAGHHGAKTGTSQLLLDTVKPEIVAISVGKNNYGHPAGETLARILASGAVIYRTDQNGTLTMKGA